MKRIHDARTRGPIALVIEGKYLRPRLTPIFPKGSPLAKEIFALLAVAKEPRGGGGREARRSTR
jgi:hypothetical protein